MSRNYFDNIREMSGVLTGKMGTQVWESARVSGAGTTTLYTVPAGKILMISTANMAFQPTGVDSFAALQWCTSAGVLVRDILARYISASAATGSESLSASRPLVIPAGAKVILTLTANGNVTAGFSGWIEQED